MGDTWVTDLGHFLDDTGSIPEDLPGPARKIAEHTAAIVEAATSRAAGDWWEAAALACRRRPGRRACARVIRVRRSEVPPEIEWCCPRCDDNGVIRGFEGTVWDNSPDAEAGPCIEERVSPAEYAALLLIGSSHPETHRAVLGARSTSHGVMVEVPRDFLEPFVDALDDAVASAKPAQRTLLDALFHRFSSYVADGVGPRRPDEESSDCGARGWWRLEEMEVWGRDYLDMEVEAFIELGQEQVGRFQFGLVQGDVHYIEGLRDGRPAVEWSWSGVDEMDAASGRGWAIIEGEHMTGRIFIHRGDHSAFRARRVKTRGR